MIKQKTNTTISVAIISHNYGQYLSHAIQSVVGQTVAPLEILVVDDASTDNTEEVARRFKKRGVSYLRVDHYSPLLSRRAALEATVGEYICFLDADDLLDPEYLEEGVRLFDNDDRIGIVYSDVEYFGDLEGRSCYPISSNDADISVENYIHAGALVRRDAIEVADAFNHGGPVRRHEDWSSWRKILSMGFAAVKQNCIYHYRKHEKGISADRHYFQGDYSYYEGAALSQEELTLFTPLAGRTDIWEQYKNFLEQQSWPHSRIRLVLMDTSNDPLFSRMVRSWLSACDYGSTEYVKYNPGRKNLADEKRIDEEGKANNELLKDVRIAMARIYNRAKESVSTNYLWIVEDDVIPPLDVCEKMFRSFCPQTVSVSAPFRHRYEQAFVAWDSSFKLLTGGEGVQTIGGNGFGCVLLRSKVFCKTVFTCSNEFPDFDQAFYAKLDNTQLAKINWDLECQHLSPFFERPVENETRPITPLNEEEFDFEYYLQRNPDVYRAVREGRFVDAYQHYSLHGWEENRPARALERKDAEKSEPNLRRLGPKVLTL